MKRPGSGNLKASACFKIVAVSRSSCASGEVGGRVIFSDASIFVERLWRTVKYEDVYLKGYQTIPEAQTGLRDYFDYYNMQRRHSSLEYKTPWMIFSGLETIDSTTEAIQTT